MLTVILQQGINGIVLGSLYVLVALGLTLIYGVLVQINFAHADIVTLGAFAAYFFIHTFGGSYLASIAVALAVGAAMGFLVNAAIFAPLRRRGSELLPLIATIGVSVLLENAMLLWFGPIPYAFESPYSQQVVRFGGIFVTMQNLFIIAVSASTIMLTFVIASALAGMGGAMLAPVLVLTPFAGASVILKAFAIAIIGGFGNFEGTIIAGLLVGLIESYT